MSGYQHPPTYAELILKDPSTGADYFNPIWLKWFVDIASYIDTAGGPFAQLAGSAAQLFSVGAATAAAHAVRLDQVGRRLGQVVTYQTGAVATGTTVIPLDNTIPQITEGDQYMSLAITPTNAASTLEIDFEWLGSHSNTGVVVTVALFQDAVANALAATVFSEAAVGYFTEANLKHIMTAGTTASTTFRVRAGGTTGATLTFNGGGGTPYLNGVLASRITIKEWLP